MNFYKLSALACVLALVGCTSVPLTTHGPATPSTSASRSSSAKTSVPVVDSGGLVLTQTKELGRTTPTPADSVQPNTVDAGPFSPFNTQSAGSRSVASLSAPADLWERIRRGYAMPNLDNDLVHDREQWYATRPDYIFRMTERSKKYLFHIVEELELRNMPTELALLPFIESAFNPQAVSGAKAAGMWQFMPATGKYFELKQNAFRDDRRDVLASTRAALDYLQKLYGMFGDWHLALAAYNWGEGSVGRAIAKNQRAGLGTSYLDLNMPMETRMYVPKLQAVKNIVSNPEGFNSKLPLIENHPYFQTVTIRRDIDVALAAKLAEVPMEDFKALNPSINRPVIFAAGTPRILLPWDNAEVFQANLESYGGGRMANWTVWVAPSTMRAADAAKRVGMSEADLRSVNAIPARMVIRAGSALLVPRPARLMQDVTEKVADNGQMSLQPEVVLRRTTVKAGKRDTVTSVAKRYKVGAAQVAQWNKVSANATFKPGQQVVLYVPVSTVRKQASSRTSGNSRNAASSSRQPARKVAKAAPTRVAKR